MSELENILEDLMEIKGRVEVKLCYGSTHCEICQRLTKLYQKIQKYKEEREGA